MTLNTLSRSKGCSYICCILCLRALMMITFWMGDTTETKRQLTKYYYMKGVCGSLGYTETHLFRCLKRIQHTNEGNTVTHLYWKAVLYWQDFQLLPGNHTSYGGIIRPSPQVLTSKRFVCWTSLQVRVLLWEHLTARH